MTATAPIRLRLLKEADLPALHAWYQAPELWDHLIGTFKARDEFDAVDYMRGWLTPTEAEIRFAIEIVRDQRLVGMVSLSPIDAPGRKAEFHIMLGDPRDRGQGLGRAATIEMLSYAFGTLHLSRIELRVRATNSIAIGLYESIGFVPVSSEGDDVIKMQIRDELVRRHQPFSQIT